MNDFESDEELEDRILVLAPTVRDGEACGHLLNNAGIRCRLCSTLTEVCHAARRGAGAALVTAEAILSDNSRQLATFLQSQPPWSDLPLIVMTPQGNESPNLVAALESIGPMTLMKRPVHVSTLVSAVRTALRDRRRQYSVRELLARQERLLQEVEAERTRLVDVFQRAPSFMCVVHGPEHVFERANISFYQLVGQRDLIGQTAREAFPEIEGHGFFELLDRVYQTGEPFVGLSVAVVLQRSPVGPPEERFIDFVFQALFDPRGAVTGVLAQGVDLTERKRSEEALRVSEAQSRTILESITDAFFALDRSWRFTYVNRQAERVLDRQPGDLLGLSLWDVYPGLRESEFERVYQRAMNEREASSVTAFYPDHNRWYEVHAYPAVDGITIYFQDVTERKQSEAELARLTLESDRQRRLFETHLSNTADLNYTFDLDGRFTYANNALLAILGRSLAEVVGRNFHDLAYPEALASRLQSQIQQVIRTRQLVRDETPYTGTAGERQYEDILVPVVGAGDVVEAVAGATRDVTERKQFVETLREADRCKDEFLATLAHELRNPLAPVRTGLHLLKLTPSGPDAAQIRDMMDRQLSHMVRLIDDLMDISRISRGKVELKRQRVELRTVIDHALETSRPLIDAGRHVLTVKLPESPIWLEADLTRLAQVVSNLLTNAAKYTPDEGAIRLVARQDGPDVVIAITDSGVGIPQAMLSQVFEMFTQVNKTLDRSQGGLGIGLSLVKRLLELHGGSIHAESPGLGRGSTFSIRLPIAPVPGDNTPVAKQSLNATTSGRRILVVDDNTDGAETLAMLLNCLGHTTRVSYDGPQALEAVSDYKPELVFLDIGLPGMNGYEVAKRLRAVLPAEPTILVALTGWGSDSDKQRSREAGFDFHLTKPIESEQVVQLIARLETEHRPI